MDVPSKSLISETQVFAALLIQRDRERERKLFGPSYSKYIVATSPHRVKLQITSWDTFPSTLFFIPLCIRLLLPFLYSLLLLVFSLSYSRNLILTKKYWAEIYKSWNDSTLNITKSIWYNIYFVSICLPENNIQSEKLIVYCFCRLLKKNTK